MRLLMRASTIVGRPVVSLGGDLIGEIKDVVFNRGEGRVVGFTLNNSGFLSGPRKESLPWDGVHALGPDAVMVRHEQSLAPQNDVLGRSDARGGSVLGARVLTDAGADLGEVTDAIVDVEDRADVVGYEFVASDALAERKGRALFIPIPDTLAVSGENLIVPAAAADFVGDDLAGFGADVENFRARLSEGR
ncbi:MAG: PRC-barrel domain-containing protein [Acidimicrobiales bacterium]